MSYNPLMTLEAALEEATERNRTLKRRLSGRKIIDLRQKPGAALSYERVTYASLFPSVIPTGECMLAVSEVYVAYATTGNMFGRGKRTRAVPHAEVGNVELLESIDGGYMISIYTRTEELTIRIPGNDVRINRDLELSEIRRAMAYVKGV